MGLILTALRRPLRFCLALLSRRPPAPSVTGPLPGTAGAAALSAQASSGPPDVEAAAAEEAQEAGAMLVPRAVALQGGATLQPAPKRRKVEAAAASPAAAAAAAQPAPTGHLSVREAARREWGPPQFARVLPALYRQDFSTAAEAVAAASGEPLPAPAKAGPPPRPNYFLALQVSQAPAVVAAIGRVQAALCKNSPHLKKACVEAESSHLTLGVMALQSEDDMARAEAALCTLGGVLAQQGLLAPLELSLGGLSHFNNQVLYLDVEEGDGLQRLLAAAEAVRGHFSECGLLQDGNRPFTPHVTIAKLSKLPRGSKGAGGRGGKRGGRGGKRGAGDKGHGHERRRDRRGGGRDRDWRGVYEAAMGEDGDVGMALAEPELGPAAAAAAAGEAAPAEESGEDVGPASAAAAAAAAGAEGGQELGEDCGPAAAAAEEEAEGEEAWGADRKAWRGGREKGKKWRRGEQQEEEPGGSGGGIPPEAYSQLADIRGGVVRVAEVQLCRMQGRKPGEYYHVVSRLALLPEGGPATAAGGRPGRAS